jgi:hypothetical protein
MLVQSRRRVFICDGMGEAGWDGGGRLVMGREMEGCAFECVAIFELFSDISHKLTIIPPSWRELANLWEESSEIYLKTMKKQNMSCKNMMIPNVIKCAP